MCVGCREMTPKKQLLRILRTVEGEVCVDRTGKKSGRGAYICDSRECLAKIRKAKLLDRALETPVSDALYDQLSIELDRREAFGKDYAKR